MIETLIDTPAPLQIRAELEAMAVKDQRGPVESCEEELKDRSVRAGLVMDMWELAEADPTMLPGMLEPLVAA